MSVLNELQPVPRGMAQGDSYIEQRQWLELLRDKVNEPVTDVYYLGDKTTDGSWRRVISGTDLLDQRLEFGVWVTKSTITA